MHGATAPVMEAAEGDPALYGVIRYLVDDKLRHQCVGPFVWGAPIIGG